MPLTLDDFNGMELMWDKMSKSPDSAHITLSFDDVDSMWHCGLVDTKSYNLDKWRAAFDAHKKPDGSFVLNKEEFLEKEGYRYKGEILIPFDAMMINEGKYTDEGLNDLFEMSVRPSCSLTKAELKRFLDDLKSKFRDKSGLVAIDKPAKIMIRQLLEENPSPLRRLELMFDYLIQQDQLAESKGQTSPNALIPGHVSAEQLARLQSNAFSMHPTTEVESKHKALSKLTKAKPKTSAVKEKEEKGVSLKKVKRSRKGMRG